jgi:lysophospholipase L1-like esterase
MDQKKSLTDLREKLVPNDALLIHVVDPLDITDSANGSDFKMKASLIADPTASHYKGNYNIVTNTPVLVNGVGRLGDEYKCTISGVRDFGAGNITVGIDDIIGYNGFIYFLKVNNNQAGGSGTQNLQQVLDEGNTATTDLNISTAGVGSTISETNIKHSFSATDEAILTGKKIKSKGNTEDIEIEAEIGILFKDISTGKIQKIKRTSSVNSDAAFSLPDKTGNQTFATIDDIPTSVAPKIFTSSLCQSFGDSITFGTAASAGKGYVQLFSTLYDVTNTSRAVGGKGVFQAVKNHNEFVLPKHNALSVVMVGLNDIRRGGNGVKTLEKIRNGYRGIICNHFLNRYVSANSGDTSITKVGTWTTYNSASVGGKTQGHYSTLSGNYNEYTFSDTNVVVAMIAGDGVTEIHGTFTVHIDGVLQGNYSLNEKTDGITDDTNNNARSPFILYFTNLTNVPHVIKVTHTNNATLPIDYFGHLSEPKFGSPLLFMDTPYLNAAGYALSPANATSAIVDELNVLLVSVINEFSSEYPIYVGKTNNFYNVTTGISGDNVHPNDVGHRQIYLAATDALKDLTIGKSTSIDILPLNNIFSGKNTFSDQTKIQKGTQIQGSFSPAPTGEGIELEYFSNQAYISSLNRAGTIYKPLNIRSSVLNFLISNVLKFSIKSTGVFNISLPIYVDDAAAGTGGLITGDIYKTSLGDIKIKI